jgi:hypothetical protein
MANPENAQHEALYPLANIRLPSQGQGDSMSVEANALPTCLLIVSGGLGNQLFQYAAGRSLASTTNARLVLDISFYDKGRHRTFELDQFPIQADVQHRSSGMTWMSRGKQLLRSIVRREQIYNEPHFQFDPNFENVRPPVTLTGYFQTYRYFEKFEPQIRKELRVPDPADPETIQLNQKLSGQNHAVLHIRRGDYVSSTKASRIYAQCTLDYYQAAMERLPVSSPVLVLSDDLPWAMENLPAVRPLVFPEGKVDRPGLADLWLMAQAQHHIIANSSFSWWGAWLAGKGGLKIAPRKWFHDSAVDDRDLIPGDWIRI